MSLRFAAALLRHLAGGCGARRPVDILAVAQQQLANRGEFYPYAAAVRADGQIELIAEQGRAPDEHLAAAEVMASCVAQLVSLHLEHAQGPALHVLLPCAMLRRGVAYGPISAHRRQQANLVPFMSTFEAN